MLASGSDPTWDLPGLYNVPSAHSFPFVKQDRSTCRCNNRTVHWQNCDQVSRTVLTLCFQRAWSKHAAVSARAVLISKLYLQIMKNGYGMGTASVSHRRLQCMLSNGGEFSGWLDRSAHIACVKLRKNLEMISDKKKRVRSSACALTRCTNGR